MKETVKRAEREREKKLDRQTLAKCETQREREREIQTVIRADMYKVLCGHSLLQKQDLPVTIMVM